ncbi:MAG TPA: S8 family serine peptidase [Steroidobacteraceae bacterium]|jgi:serine protease|nr:S8 family serine peptidase [Steroidobacteraceae bacterium]
MRPLAWIVLMAVTAAAVAATVATERNPVRTHPRLAAPAAAQRLIVKLRSSTAAPAGGAQPEARERVAALIARTGLTLLEHRPITELMHAVRVQPLAEATAGAVLARLRADPEVEYAVPDEQRYIHSVPSDPLFAQQWYLQVAAATPSAIDAQDAWNTTTGSASLVIADIDTGVRPDHPDLAARLLTGYCFISDAVISNGGSCPGPGATDPGDWVTSSDITTYPAECSQATAAPSSWHGTRTAGILGALTNNAVGVAGITWSAQILPVRALGKCGGFDSDIMSAMLWAGGVAVSGAPANANPAKIINMSIGGTGSCPASYADAIGQLAALGVLIVASAGNEGSLVDAPANCAGVAGVAGLRQAGTKVGYSSLGPEVALAAPAGNCGNSFTTEESSCEYTITTTTNLAAMSPLTPDANDYTGLYYCDSTTGSYANCSISTGEYRTYNIGTSFSAPIVSGIAALMSSVNSKLNSCQMISRLKEGAQPFPQTSLDATTQPPMCHVPTGSSDLQESECICTRDDQTCGAGMANAPASVSAALRPIAAVSLPASVTDGQSLTLDGSASGAANGHSVSSYQWSAVSGGVTLAIGSAATPKATVTAPACGVATVALTVTDDAGRTDTADVVVTPSSVSSSAPAAAGQHACSTVAPAILIAVCPATDSVRTGGTATFVASVANTTNTAVSWQVNGVTGGSATDGTISSMGVYTAPASVPATGTVSVSATSQADGTSAGSAQVAISSPASSGGGGGGGALDWLTLFAAGARVLQLRQRRTLRRQRQR